VGVLILKRLEKNVQKLENGKIIEKKKSGKKREQNQTGITGEIK